jgi:hypothetical protein
MDKLIVYTGSDDRIGLSHGKQQGNPDGGEMFFDLTIPMGQQAEQYQLEVRVHYEWEGWAFEIELPPGSTVSPRYPEGNAPEDYE